jgi:cell division protein FtsL
MRQPVELGGSVQKGRRPPVLAVVSQPHPQRGRRAFLLVSFLLISILVVAVVVLQTWASQSAFRLEELTQQARSLQDEQRELTLQVAMLQAPDRIKKAGRDLGLHLVPLEGMQTLVVRRPGPSHLSLATHP